MLFTHLLTRLQSMKLITQLLKLGAILSLLNFAIVSMITIPSLFWPILTLKVQNKYISGTSYVIEGAIANRGGKIVAGYSQSFFNKAQLGDTIRFNSSYRLLLRDGHIESIYIRERVWFLPPLLLSALITALIFLPNNRLLKSRFSYWFIAACEAVNIFILYMYMFAVK